MTYEEISLQIIEIAIAGIESEIKGGNKATTKYNRIRYMIEATEDILQELYNKYKTNETGETLNEQ